ncbi:hypothetical protein [Halomonas sp. A3H3]|jgi:hypothetical protein|uniref:hypothetical protein n=1 Tax=Halomonas sp. A3H3 TaxID=1346287 RepID=UPI001EE1A6A5|nr:hypothetical protein [Halomonas sp. A3H3]
MNAEHFRQVPPLSGAISGIMIRPKRLMAIPIATGEFVARGALSIPHPVNAINTSSMAWAMKASPI